VAGPREELGSTDAPAEDEVTEAFDRIVSEGAQRLHRSWREVLTTGLAGGLEVATGVMALLAVYAETGSHLLAGLAFSMPVTAVVAGRASLAQLGRLWAGTLVANLVGGWIVMWLVVHALPSLGATAIESATTFLDAPLDLTSACLAVLAGSIITLMTRMQHGAASEAGKLAAAVAGAFLLAGLMLFHSILDSLIIFGGIHAGGPFGYGDWLAWFWYTALLNLAGGLVVVTFLRLVRSKELIERERSAARGES
jgi:formate/nitrite transporter FocA (FNT family)